MDNNIRLLWPLTKNPHPIFNHPCNLENYIKLKLLLTKHFKIPEKRISSKSTEELFVSWLEIYYPKSFLFPVVQAFLPCGNWTSNPISVMQSCTWPQHSAQTLWSTPLFTNIQCGTQRSCSSVSATCMVACDLRLWGQLLLTFISPNPLGLQTRPNQTNHNTRTSPAFML